MADFEELHGVGFDFNPNCNVWYRIKANIIDSVDDLKASEEDKVRLRKKFAGIVGIPVFHVGEDSKHDSILVASMNETKLMGFDKKYFYKIESKPYMKNLKKHSSRLLLGTNLSNLLFISSVDLGLISALASLVLRRSVPMKKKINLAVLNNFLTFLNNVHELTERGWVHEATGTMYKKCSKLFDTFKESYSGNSLSPDKDIVMEEVSLTETPSDDEVLEVLREECDEICEYLYDVAGQESFLVSQVDEIKTVLSQQLFVARKV